MTLLLVFPTFLFFLWSFIFHALGNLTVFSRTFFYLIISNFKLFLLEIHNLNIYDLEKYYMYTKVMHIYLEMRGKRKGIIQ